MNEKETILFGIPVPSDSRFFLTLVVFHILLALICVLSGLVAMLARKGQRIHVTAGKIYYWGLVFVFVTVIILSILRWPYDNHLLVLGFLSFFSAYAGRRLARNQREGWTRPHTVYMGFSYILLLTAFYVDNGKNLPFWNQFPQIFFWLFPSLVGIPIVIYALKRHPLNRN